MADLVTPGNKVKYLQNLAPAFENKCLLKNNFYLKNIVSLVKDIFIVEPYIASRLPDHTGAMGKDRMKCLEIAAKSIEQLVIWEITIALKDGVEWWGYLLTNEHSGHLPILLPTLQAL